MLAAMALHGLKGAFYRNQQVIQIQQHGALSLWRFVFVFLKWVLLTQKTCQKFASIAGDLECAFKMNV